VLPPLALADMIAGLYGANATVTALYARMRGLARGQVIDVSLLEAIFSILGPEAAIYRHTGAVKERVGSASNTSAPRNVYRCADGKYVALSASMQSMAKRVLAVIGRPEMIEEERFRTNSARVKPENRAALDAAVGGWFAQRTREEALRVMRENEVTVGPVYNIDDAVEDEHFRRREIIVEAQDEDLGAIPMHNIVPRLSATPGVWRRPAPSLGEHTDEILKEAGYDAAGITALRACKAAA
jgi:crotonobetainyl-CoA:carnitine CoA-transferase CaiB-like acyl-CoA transferase